MHRDERTSFPSNRRPVNRRVHLVPKRAKSCPTSAALVTRVDIQKPKFIADVIFDFRLHGVTVRWDVNQLKRMKVEELRVALKPEDGSEEAKEASASVEDGSVDFDELTSYTMHVLELGGYQQDDQIFLNQRTLRTWPSAPSPIQRAKGRAISTQEIYIKWKKPTLNNGILQPYFASCVSAVEGSAPVSASTKDNETESITVRGLLPNTEYRCTVVAKTIPADGQEPSQCESRTELPTAIRTMALVFVAVVTSSSTAANALAPFLQLLEKARLKQVNFVLICPLHVSRLEVEEVCETRRNGLGDQRM
ncbi:unnamed protein product [Hydatigera taeniaeformis]|uniref:Fibronectin type-III domain-containing protein n=1 Tax=Hydatigena taeniaeformis TaxID=6205 RepID=A0A0R3WV48_HYDTA|nr:unnamed protein product [Hydatigera taeniaeformis]